MDQVLTRILRLHTHCKETDASKHVLQSHIPQAQSRNHAPHFHAYGVSENQGLHYYWVTQAEVRTETTLWFDDV